MKAEVRQTQAAVSSSTSNVHTLIEKSEKLRDLIKDLKKSVTNESQKSKIMILKS